LKPVPKQIQSRDDVITLQWSDAHESRYAPRDLRLACRCAACLDEWTQQPLVDPASVPPRVKALGVETVGNYALHFSWSDGHNTGIYTYDYLREVCGCEGCRAQRSFDV